MNILPGETACLSCVFPQAPTGMVETCDTSGILNSAVNLVASLEATEAMKFLVGAKDKLRRTMISFDLWANDHAEISTAKPRSDCKTRQRRDFRYLAGDCGPHITFCGRNSVQIHGPHRPISFANM